MALTAANVLARASALIQDQTNVRWPEAELLNWLNDGRREICVARPDLYATISVVTLAGGTKQQIPADGARFLDAYRNMEADGIAPGDAVRPIQREILDAQLPAWHTATAAATKHFMFDERVPRFFYVYPPAAANAKLEIAYSQTPTDITSTSTALTQEDIYTGALVDYICYRAFSKDATYAGNAARAIAHYQQFKNALGEGDARDLTVSPNLARIDGVPPKSGG